MKKIYIISLFLLFVATQAFAMTQSEDYNTTSISEEFQRETFNENKKFLKGVESYVDTYDSTTKSANEETTKRIHRVLKRENSGNTLRDIGAQTRDIRTLDSDAKSEKIDSELNSVQKGIENDDTRTSSELRNTAKEVLLLNTRAAKLKYKIRRSVSKDFDKVMRDVSKKVREREVDVSISNPDTDNEENARSFIDAKREEKLQEVAKKLKYKKKQINDYVDIVVDSSARGKADVRAIDTVLYSSIDEVEDLVYEETGVKVDLAVYSRKVVRNIKDDTQKFQQQVKSFNSRGGLDLYRDTDGDGVSDYDETYIYYSDPKDAFTSKSSLTDGERILFGFDVHSTSTERVAVESPESSGIVTKAIFEVDEISETKDELLKFKGKALPNSFVTLYVFSTPIVVTVKADENGKWEYTLDAQLPDGNHSLYVATVNNAGKILAKSAKVPFTKTAEAIQFTPLAASISEPTPLSILQENALVTALFLFAIFFLVMVLVLGSWKARSFSLGNQ